MANLTRVTGKVFAGDASSDQVGQFGSAAAGDPTNTTDVATIQSLSAYGQGWGEAVIPTRNFPPLEEVNGVLKTISYQTCYLLQEGVPTYDSGTNYSVTSIVKTISGDDVLFYRSLKNDNIGNALSDTTSWEKVYFENEYEPNITANRSLSLTGAVTGSINYKLSDPANNSLSIATTGKSKTISLSGAVSGSATLNTGNTNSVSISTTLNNTNKIDGQWVHTVQLLSSENTRGDYELNLNSYLPNNSYDYDIKIYLFGYYKGDSYSNTYVTVSNSQDTLRESPTNYLIAGDTVEINCENNNDVAENTGIISTKNGSRNLYLKIKGNELNLTNCQVYATSYRRIGTNT